MKTNTLSPILLTLLISEVVHARQRKGVFLPEDESEVILHTTFKNTPTKFTYRQGQEAKLQCSLQDLGSKKVIWRRKSDPNPLTIGRNTFVDDKRISVEHKYSTPDWTLTIKEVRLDDAGQYECQVSSKNRSLRRYITLEVRPGRKRQRQSNQKKGDSQDIAIHGKTYVEKDGKLKLVCNATGGGHSPDDLDWFRNGQKLGTDRNKKVKIQERMSLTEKTIYSTLIVASVDMGDAGIYVCRTSDLQIASTRVDVLNANTNNVKRDSNGELKDGTKSDQDSLQDKKGNGARTLVASSPTTICLLVLSALAAKFSHREIFLPT